MGRESKFVANFDQFRRNGEIILMTGELISLAACRIALIVEVEVQLNAGNIKLIIIIIIIRSLTW